jgi:hypothetical protein
LKYKNKSREEQSTGKMGSGTFSLLINLDTKVTLSKQAPLWRDKLRERVEGLIVRLVAAGRHSLTMTLF